MKNTMLAILALFMLQANTAFAFDEGFEYNLVKPPQATSDPAKVEVLELFWYGCPHCNEFEPNLNKWLKNKPEDVKFVRVPAIFRKSWAIHARAYYTAEALGVLDKLHSKIFHEIHNTGKKKTALLDEVDIEKFFVKHGVKREDFKRTWDSFVVQARVKRAVTLTRSYGINGVPAMIVNGKYRTSAKEAGIQDPAKVTNDQMMKVVDWLVERERMAAKAAKK